MARHPAVTSFTAEQEHGTQTLRVAWTPASPGAFGRLARALGITRGHEVALRPAGASTPWLLYPVPQGTELVTRLTGPQHTVVDRYEARVRTSPEGEWSPVVKVRVTVHDVPAPEPAPPVGSWSSSVTDRILSAASYHPEQPASASMPVSPTAETYDAARTEALTQVLRAVVALEARLAAGTAAALREAASVRR